MKNRFRVVLDTNIVLVSNCRHFDVLKEADFPKVTLINIDEFKEMF